MEDRSIYGLSGGDITPGAPTVEIPQPFELKPVSVPLYNTKEQFIVDLACKLFQAQLSVTTSDASDNANKAFRNAIVFWNKIGNKYRQAVLKEGANADKIKI